MSQHLYSLWSARDMGLWSKREFRSVWRFKDSKFSTSSFYWKKNILSSEQWEEQLQAILLFQESRILISVGVDESSAKGGLLATSLEQTTLLTIRKWFSNYVYALFTISSIFSTYHSFVNVQYSIMVVGF